MQLGADQSSLALWLLQQQDKNSSLSNLSIEIRDFSNASMIVCQDGPKILVKPDASHFIKCFTEQQWIEKLWADLKLSTFHYPIIVFNILIFLFGTTGNVFVCLSVRRNYQLRNVTNYFIVNLALADLLVILICLPATALWDLYLTWFFGTIPCKLIMFLQDVSISVSVLTLTAISIDRYYAICHPLKFKSSLSQAKRIIAIIWVVSLITMAPDLIYLSAHKSQDLLEAQIDTVLYSDCNYEWSERSSKLFQFVKTVLLYFIPFVLMFCAHYKILQALRRASTSVLEELNIFAATTSSSVDCGGSIMVTTQIPTAIGNGAKMGPPTSDARVDQRKNKRIVSSSSSTPASEQQQLANHNQQHETRQQASKLVVKQGANEANVLAHTTSDSSSSLPPSRYEGSNFVDPTTVDGRKLSSSVPVTSSPLITATNRQVHFQEYPLTEAATSMPTQSVPVLQPAEPAELRLKQTERCDKDAKSAPPPAPFYSIRSNFAHKLSSGTIGRAANSNPVIKFFGGTNGARPNGDESRTGSQENDDCNKAVNNHDSNRFVLTMHNKNRLESRQRAAKMLSAIVIIFGICFLPVHLINFLRQFIDNIPQNDVTSTISMLSHCVCYLNSAINPIIYNHMNSIFRQEFHKLLQWRLWRTSHDYSKGPHLHRNNSSFSSLNRLETSVDLLTYGRSRKLQPSESCNENSAADSFSLSPHDLAVKLRPSTRGISDKLQRPSISTSHAHMSSRNKLNGAATNRGRTSSTTTETPR